MAKWKNSSCGDACHTQAVDAVFWVELLATTLAGKHMATALPNFVLATHFQRLETFVTDITEVNPLSLLCLAPHTDPMQQQHDFLTNLPSTPAGLVPADEHPSSCPQLCLNSSSPPTPTHHHHPTSSPPRSPPVPPI